MGERRETDEENRRDRLRCFKKWKMQDVIKEMQNSHALIQIFSYVALLHNARSE